MKTIVYSESLPIAHPRALFEREQPIPKPGSKDVLVKIEAIAVNPVDCKIRTNITPAPGEVKILGWDAAGTVQSVGDEVSSFKPGDCVYYAGDLTRPGCNAQFQLVDERIVAKAPKTLSVSEAAALPLTSITAWELLFDRLGIPQGDSEDSIVVIVTGAAGGVGSVAIQLLKQLTNAIVVATASRPESKAWVKSLGADHVVDHSGDLRAQVGELGLGLLDYVVSLTHSDQHYLSLIELMKPQSKFGLIDDPLELDIKAFKRKSISLHWEFMYTRSMFETRDMVKQRLLLEHMALLLDEGKIKTTVGQHMGCISAANLKRAHQAIETQHSVGKIVLEGFE